MAFFLKKSTLKGRTYLSIVESYYSPQKHGGAHRTYKSLASVETWKEKGIDDPIAYFQKKWMNSTKIIKTRILLRFPIILLNSILDIFHSYP